MPTHIRAQLHPLSGGVLNGTAHGSPVPAVPVTLFTLVPSSRVTTLLSSESTLLSAKVKPALLGVVITGRGETSLRLWVRHVEARLLLLGTTGR